jgi:hypothetical protein
MTTLPIAGERPDLGEIPAEPVKRVGRPPGSKNQKNEHRDAERARTRTERERKIARYEKQESKRTEPIQPDQRGPLVVTLILAGIAMVTSGIISYNGITSVAQFVGLSETWMAGLFFGFIELLIVVFTMLYLIYGSRVNEDGNPVNAAFEFIGMITFSALAVYGNLIHTLEFHDYALNTESVTGVALSVAAPIAVVWLTKSASRVLFARPVRL